METAPGSGNRKLRRTARSAMKLRPLDHVDKVASTRVAFEESVKDNLAEKVVDNFVLELTKLPFWKRVRFGLGIIFRR